MQSEANLRSVFENTELCIVLLDQDLRVLTFNRNAYELSIKNYRKPLETGQPALSFFPEDRQLIMRQMAERALTGEHVSYEVFYEFNGIIEWYEVRWRSYQLESGERAGLILTFRDITLRKQQEQERSKMTADLTRHNQELEQFAYIVSHNLRAPVANILGLVQLLKADEQANEDQVAIYSRLLAATGRLDEVITDLNLTLQLSRRISDGMEAVNLRELAEDIIASVPQLTGRKDIRFEFDLQTPEVYTVKSYVHSILQNLILNALKYRRPEVETRVVISSLSVKSRIFICVADNGKGIDLRRHGESIFGLYKRFDTSVEGKGMGLFMVKTQVESLGGSIRVESEPGRGSKFTIELPLR